MARLFHSGAEIDAGATNTANFAFADSDPDGDTEGTVTRDTAVFRSGAASWKCDSTGSNVPSYLTSDLATYVDGRSYFARAYVRAASAPATAALILAFTGGPGPGARLRTDGGVELIASSAAQGSPSASIVDSNWHRIEVKATAAATGIWSAGELLVDGVSIATWSGSIARANFLFWGWLQTPGASKIINVDDVAVNDSTGAANTSYPGAGAIVLLKPTADSAKGTGWTNDAAGTTNFFNAVSNTPPAGIADTTASTGLHQIRNATANANSSYDATMTTYTAAGIAAGATINAVIPWVATAAPVTTSAKLGTVGVVSNPAITNINLGTIGTSGAFWGSPAAGTYGTGWKWSPGTMTNAPSVTLGTAPVMRITQVTSSTRIAMVCFMGIYVDYSPAAAPSFTPKPKLLARPGVAVLRAGVR